MAVFGFSYGMMDPATNALIAQVWPAGGRKGFNLVYVARNGGVALGTALGGMVASLDFTLILFLQRRRRFVLRCPGHPAHSAPAGPNRSRS